MKNPFLGLTPFNLLLVRMSALGDIIHCWPALAALRRHYPRTRLYWLVDKPYRPLLERLDEIDDTVAFDRPEVTRELKTLQWFWQAIGLIWATVKVLRKLKLSGSINFQPLIRSSLFAWLSGARVRIGFNRLSEGGWLLHNNHVGVRRNQHVILQNMALLSTLGVDAIPKRTTPSLKKEDFLPLESFLASYQLSPENMVAICPASSKAEKQWTIEGYAALADTIADKQKLTPVLVWGNGEETLAKQILGAMKHKGLLAPSLDLPQLAAFLSKATYTVAPDTGPLHLAAAMGCPVVGIYGPTNPDIYGPYWEPNRIVDHHPKNLWNRRPSSLESLEPEPVFTACDSLYQQLRRISQKENQG